MRPYGSTAIRRCCHERSVILSRTPSTMRRRERPWRSWSKAAAWCGFSMRARESKRRSESLFFNASGGAIVGGREMPAWDFQSSSASPIPMLPPSASRTVLPAAQTSPLALLAPVNAWRGLRCGRAPELTRRRTSFFACDFAAAGFSFLRLRRLGTRGFDMAGLGDPHRKHPSNPQERKIEHEEDDETDLAAKLEFGDETDGVGSEIACDHEDDVIDDEPHDDVPLMPNAWEGNPQPRRQDAERPPFGARPELFNIFLTPT